MQQQNNLSINSVPGDLDGSSSSVVWAAQPIRTCLSPIESHLLPAHFSPRPLEAEMSLTVKQHNLARRRETKTSIDTESLQKRHANFPRKVKPRSPTLKKVTVGLASPVNDADKATEERLLQTLYKTNDSGGNSNRNPYQKTKKDLSNQQWDYSPTVSSQDHCPPTTEGRVDPNAQ